MSILCNHVQRLSCQLNLLSISSLNSRLASSLASMPEAPKKPKGAFFEFAMAKQGNKPWKDLGETMKAYSLSWKELPAADKEVFLLKEKQNKEEYLKRKDEFLANLKKNNQLEEYMKQKAVARLEKSLKKTKLELKDFLKGTNKPKMGNSNPYGFFVQDQMEKIKADLPGKKGKEIFKEIPSYWGKLSDAEKSKYKDRAKMVQAQYLKDLDSWHKTMKSSDKMEALAKLEKKLQRKKLDLKRVINPAAVRPKSKKRVAKKKVKKVAKKVRGVAKKKATSKKGSSVAAKKKVAKAK